MRASLVVVVVLSILCRCVPTSDPPAKRWTGPDIYTAAKAGKTIGGFDARQLIVLAGAEVPFSGPLYESPPKIAPIDAFAILPAFALGQTAAYVVTELWENHPNPWVQPVYMLMAGFDPFERLKVDQKLVPIVFGVGRNSTFYSPFWEAYLVLPRGAVGAEGVPDTRAVLSVAKEIREGALLLCPIIPPELSFAGNDTAQRPLTAEPVKLPSPGVSRTDGFFEPYVDFGPDRFRADKDGRLISTRIYFFNVLIDGKSTQLPLPAVLADDAATNGFARRVDVILDGNASVFVPGDARWNDLRAQLSKLVVKAPLAAATIPAALAAQFTLRVATNASCFTSAANFPAGCTWLDSESKILSSLSPRKLLETQVTLSAVPVSFPGGPR